MSNIKFKHKEDETLAELLEYISATYSQHYTNPHDDHQTTDTWKARGTLVSTSIDTATKYLDRFGKKKGKNRTDLIKAIHYIILALSEHPKV